MQMWKSIEGIWGHWTDFGFFNVIKKCVDVDWTIFFKTSVIQFNSMTHNLIYFRQGFFIAKKDPKMLSEVVIQVIIIAQLFIF